MMSFKFCRTKFTLRYLSLFFFLQAYSFELYFCTLRAFPLAWFGLCRWRLSTSHRHANMADNLSEQKLLDEPQLSLHD